MRDFMISAAVFGVILFVSVGCAGKPVGQPMTSGDPSGVQEDMPRGEEDLPKTNQGVRSTEVGEPLFGDLEEILDRGFLRVLVAPSRTNFFFDQGDFRGFDVDLMRAFRDDLNRGRKKKEMVQVIFVPRPFGDLLPSLKDGVGDVAIGGMTVLPSRTGATVFSDPYLKGVEEVVVQHRSVSGLNSLEDLGGRTLTIRSNTSYQVHLEQMVEDFRQRGLEPPSVSTVGDFLATEDILEMVNAGIIDLTVADRHLADAWAGVMPDLVVRSDLIIREGEGLAMAVRSSDSQLHAALNDFVRRNRKGSLLGNVLFTRYFEKSAWLKNPTADFEARGTAEVAVFFQKYAERYGFDWLDIAAQAYRESGFDQSKRSRAGAVGMMQIRPSTAADKNVGIQHVELLENNIHAGVKYLAFVRDRYFSEPDISPEDRGNFALAAYNAGPRRVVNARSRASEQGLDPNQWFNHVELVVAQEVGLEPVNYVRDIHAYSFALRMAYDEGSRRELDRESIEKGDLQR